MFERHIFFVSVLCILSRASEDCSAVAKGDQFFKFSFNYAKNLSGHWTTTSNVIYDSNSANRGFDGEFQIDRTPCGNRRYVVHIGGDLTEDVDTLSMTRLSFHPRYGRNIRLDNDRKTAYRMNMNLDQGVVYTDRPLRRQEMLTVRLDKITSTHPFNLGIGVTTHSPFEKDTPDEGIHAVSNMWLYYHTHIHINGSLDLHHYGKDLDNDSQFKVGDHVGVIVSHSGELHFFVNGVDQGPAADKIPDNVYGVIELRSKTLQVTIVDQS